MAARAVSRHAAPPKILPPSSPFGELLRRSNFASYDPAIRQTYTAPSSYTHRGNWGLKRPIANRKRGNAIVLRKFEEHAQFIEWDKASTQVEYIKRVEELYIRPTLKNAPWMQSLGPMANTIDSEFCPTDLQAVDSPVPVPALEVKAEPAPSTHAFSLNLRPGRPKHNVGLTDFGNKGQGKYGVNADTKTGETYLQPNIAAMSPQQFADYLEELRELRPKFLEYIRKEIKGRRGRDDTNTQDPDDLPDGELVLSMAKEATDKTLHRYFLGQHTHDKFAEYSEKAAEEADAPENVHANEPQPIQGQPHRNAGLVYANPTKLETYYTSRVSPGLVLQSVPYRIHVGEGHYITAFAGMSATLMSANAGNNVSPLLDPFSEEGLALPMVPNAERTGTTIDLSRTEKKMRIMELALMAPPKVVGAHVPNASLVHVKVLPRVAVADSSHERRNPHRPGSREFYNAKETENVKPKKWGTGYEARQNPRGRPSIVLGKGPEQPQTNSETANVLRTIMGMTKRNK